MNKKENQKNYQKIIARIQAYAHYFNESRAAQEQTIQLIVS